MPPGVQILNDAGSESLHPRQPLPAVLRRPTPFTHLTVRNNTLYRDGKPDAEFVAWYARGAHCVVEGNRVRPYRPPPR